MFSRAILLVPIVLAIATAAYAETAWISSSEYRNFHIVLSADAHEVEKEAATRFQRHWGMSTGAKIDISTTARAGAVNVWVGLTDNPFISMLGLDKLGEEGIAIRTLDSGYSGGSKVTGMEGKHLIIAGNSFRATLYAEWEFFEQFTGVRFYDRGPVQWPPTPGQIPHIHFRYEPPLAYRDVSYWHFNRWEWIAHYLRLNGHWSGVRPEWGGHTAYVRGFEGFGHTFHSFVDPEELFDAHPEYFAEIDGERRKYAQLCLTNTDVLEITIGKVRALLREAEPHERIVSVSQMDYPWFDSWCTCVKCKAVDDREGGQSGTIVHFVNAVADAIAEDFPDAYVDTLAYMYSRKPPKRVMPRPNVIVRVSAIECDYSTPLSDRSSPRNRAFVGDLRTWVKLSPNVIVWDYTQNWYSHQGPHPNVHVLQPNIRFLANEGVKGIFEQGGAFTRGSDFEILKGTILGRALWNPDVDWRKIYDEFLSAYYGDAAPYVDEYLDIITERVRRDDVVLTFNNRMRWMDYDLVERSQEIFAEAFETVRDPEVLERLRYAYLPVQYAALVCPPRVFPKRNSYVLVRPPSQTFDEYWTMLKQYGVTRLNDWPISAFRDRLDGRTPPRREVVPIEKLDNGRLNLWVLPTRGGSVVRMRNRERHRDLLNGFEDILGSRGKMRDFFTPDEEKFAPLYPVDEVYEVLEKGDAHILMGVTLGNGLELRREVALGPDENSFSVEVRLLNPTDAALRPRVEFYPEFSIEGSGTGQLWISREGIWARQRVKKGKEKGVYEDEFPASGIESWAWRFPKSHTTILSTVDDDDVEQLSYVYAPRAGIASMGQRVHGAPLAPGEVRLLKTTFEFSRTPPKQLTKARLERVD